MSNFKKKQRKVAEALDASFNKTELVEAFFSRAKNFCKAHQKMLLAEGADLEQIETAHLIKNPNKTTVAEICALLFASKNCYETFRVELSPEQHSVWNELIWTGEMHQSTIERRLGVRVFQEQKKVYSSTYSTTKTVLLPDFSLFKSASVGSYYDIKFLLSIPIALRQLLVEYHEKPASAQLSPLRGELPATQFVYDTGERDILSELPRVLAYKEQGQLSVTGKDRPNPIGLPKMQRSLGLREFFPDADERRTKTLRSWLLAAIAANLRSQMLSGSGAVLVRAIFNTVFLEKLQVAPALLPDLKGTGYLEDSDFYKREAAIFDLLKKLPAGEWVNFENIRDHARYNLIDLKAVSDWNAANKLYYEFDDGEAQYSFEKKHYIGKDLYSDAIVQSYLRGGFFLFAAFGLCDLAYDSVDLSQLGRTVFSSWDGLRRVRRTALGDFVCGAIRTFDASSVAAPSKIALSPDTLLLTCEGSDAGVAAILEPYAERVSPNRFRTDNQIFLKNIRSKKELEAKISLFKQVVGSELPPNWQSFFREMQMKINPFESPGEMHILQIPAENRALIQLVAQDSVLRSQVVKAEGYLLLVPKEKYAAFRRRLQEFGYLLT